MTYRIWKRFAFSAAHHLLHVPEDHPCARPHGHNYEVEVELSAPVIGAPYWVRDYSDLDEFVAWIKEVVDHRDLNEVAHLPDTTAELLAHWLYDVLQHELGVAEVVAVRVSETPKTWAEWRP